MKPDFQESVGQALQLLVAGRYVDLERLTEGVRLSASDIAAAVTEYGRRLIIPPLEGYNLMDVVEIRGAKPRRWSVRMPLWTEEEGRSDLSIDLTVCGDHKPFRIELNDIHVL